MTDLSGRLKEASTAAKEKVEDAADRGVQSVVKSVDQAAGSAQSAGSGAFERAESIRDAALETTVSVSEAVKASIERQPFTAVAVAAVTGFVFGMFFFRRT